MHHQPLLGNAGSVDVEGRGGDGEDGGGARDGGEMNDAPPRRKNATTRNVPLDLFRGLICAAMAWDHCTHAYVSTSDLPKTGGGEFWNGDFTTFDDSPRLFIARAVSHICATGFFFSMGLGMWFFIVSRMGRAQWAFSRVARHYLTRGLVLALLVGPFVGLFWRLPLLTDVGVHHRSYHFFFDKNVTEYHKGAEWEIFYQSFFHVTDILMALGLTMTVMPPILYLFHRVAQMAGEEDTEQEGGKRRDLGESWKSVLHLGPSERFGFLLFIVFFVISNVAIVLAQGDDPSDATGNYPKAGAKADTLPKILGRLMLWPGKSFGERTRISDPVIPWIGITCLGVGLGLNYQRGTTRYIRLKSLALSAFFLSLFLVVRGAAGKFGNYRGWPRHDEGASTFMEFFLVCKYPPDLAYASITLGVNFLIIAVFHHAYFETLASEEEIETSSLLKAEEEAVVRRVAKRLQSVLIRSVLHYGRVPLFFYAFHLFLIGASAAVFRFFNSESVGKFHLQYIIIVWLCVLAVAAPLCAKFHVFKSATPHDSLWRLF